MRLLMRTLYRSIPEHRWYHLAGSLKNSGSFSSAKVGRCGTVAIHLPLSANQPARGSAPRTSTTAVSKAVLTRSSDGKTFPAHLRGCREMSAAVERSWSMRLRTRSAAFGGLGSSRGAM